MTDDQIKHMVDRFLSWKLPSNFNPDAGISYTRPNYAAGVDATPSGTNLLDATQADAMVRHMIEGMTGLLTQADDDEAYEIGKRDGYESAIQDLDIATGGDGEFKGSTFPGETVDVPVMKARVIDRCRTTSHSE